MLPPPLGMLLLEKVPAKTSSGRGRDRHADHVFPPVFPPFMTAAGASGI